MSIQLRPFDKVLWNAAAAAPETLFAMPGIAATLSEFKTAIPGAETITPFETNEAVRPYRHLRAFYLRKTDGVIAVKGSEVFASDVEQMLAVMSGFRIDFLGRGKSLFSALEHFALNEQKIPLALSVDEAMEDVSSAAAVQRAHVARYGARAHTPLPLLAVRWPDTVTEAHLKRLSTLLSARARKSVERVAADGLGAVVYHYPTVPQRVAHLPEILRTRSEKDWLARLAAIADPQAAVNGWLDVVARLLVLGFLPGSVESIGVGHCLEMKNAVIDGGLVDMGSICRVEDVTDPRQFSETLLAALADLAKTCRHFLRGDVVDVEAEYRNPSLAMVLALHRLLPDLARRMEQLGGADPRIMEFFKYAAAADSLPVELSRLSPDSGGAGGHA